MKNFIYLGLIKMTKVTKKSQIPLHINYSYYILTTTEFITDTLIVSSATDTC